MRLIDIIYSIFIIILLLLIIIAVVCVNQIQSLTENWGKDKCSPVNMLFARLIGIDSEENMNECVKNQQEYHLNISMEPLYSTLSSTLDGIQSGFGYINDTRNRMRESALKNISHFMGFGRVFNMISVQVQLTITKLQDTFSKIMGITTTIMYMIDGGRLTGLSVWNGPFGNATRLLCFHPETPIEIRGGQTKHIKDIETGTMLKQGNRVIGTLKLLGNKHNNNPYYMLYSEQLNRYIYVTGSHYILKPDKHISKVEDYELSTRASGMETDELYCLITDNHFINIGEHCFLDWEYQ